MGGNTNKTKRFPLFRYIQGEQKLSNEWHLSVKLHQNSDTEVRVITFNNNSQSQINTRKIYDRKNTQNYTRKIHKTYADTKLRTLWSISSRTTSTVPRAVRVNERIRRWADNGGGRCDLRNGTERRKRKPIGQYIYMGAWLVDKNRWRHLTPLKYYC